MTGTLEDVHRLLVSQIGYTEYPRGSNRTKYGQWWGQDGQRWCLIFQQWAFTSAGCSLAIRTAYTPSLADKYREIGRWTREPEVGALALFDLPGGANRIEHVGWVESFNPTTVVTIDGNTSVSGSQSNGGAVMRRSRARSLVVGYARPLYRIQEAPMSVIDLSHPAFFIPLAGQGPESEWVPIALKYASKANAKGDFYRNFQILQWDRNAPPAPSAIPRDSVAVGLNWAGWPKVTGANGGATIRLLLDFLGVA